MGQQTGRDKAAAGEQRRRNHALFHRDVVIFLLTAAAAIGSLDVFHYFVLGRYIGQLPPQDTLPALMQRASAFRADTLSLRQLMDNLFYRQTGKIHFPFSGPFFLL